MDMKVSVEDVSPVQKRLSVEIPSEAVKNLLDKTVNQLKRTVSVAGFRKGKVPRSIIERDYSKEIQAEVMQELVKDTLGDAIRQSEVIMLLEPQLDSSSEIESGKPFTYSVLMDIEPDFEVPDFRKFELVRPAVEVTDEELEEQIQALRKHFGRVEIVDEPEPLGEGDIAIIDYDAYIDGEEVKDLEQRDYYVEIGQGNLNETLEHGMLGMEKGEEREIEVSYPEDAINAAVAGKTVKYRITLKNIQRRELPDLNDEFAEKMGVGLKTVEDLKERLRQQILADKQKAADGAVRQQLFDKLLEGADFTVPERLIEKKLDQMIDNVAGHMQERGVNLEQAGIDEEKLREKMRDEAEKQAKTELMMDKIAEEEKVEIPSDELKKYSDYVDEHYKEMNVSREQFHSAVFESVLPKLRAQQTLEYILKNVTIKDEAEEEKSEDSKTDE